MADPINVSNRPIPIGGGTAPAMGDVTGQQPGRLTPDYLGLLLDSSALNLVSPGPVEVRPGVVLPAFPNITSLTPADIARGFGGVISAGAGGATVPAAITTLAAGAAGDGLIPLTWTAPANGGSAITDYVVQYRTSAGPGAWQTFADGTSAATGATVTGLTNGTGYDFRVFAVNAVGQGPASNVVSGTPVASGSALVKNYKVLVVGDSTTFGVGANPAGSDDYSGSYPYAVPAQIAAALNAVGVPARKDTWAGWGGASGAVNLYRTGVAVANQATSSRSPLVGGSFWSLPTSGGGGYLEFPVSATADRLEVGYALGPSFGSLTVFADSVLLATIPLASASNGVGSQIINIPLGTSVVRFASTGGTAHGPAWMSAYSSTVNSVHVYNAGMRNRQTSALLTADYPTSPLNAYSAMLPDVVIIDTGINDWRQAGETRTTLADKIQQVITAALAASAKVILCIPHDIASYNQSSYAWTFAEVRAMYQALAAANPTVVLFDAPAAYFAAGLSGATNPATYAALNANGHMYDGLHGKATLYAAEGAGLAAAVRTALAI